jgi:hypothetical protein
MKALTSIVLVCLILISGFAWAPGYEVDHSKASESTRSILKVGQFQTYTKIKDAITAASPGDTIIVDNGTYTEKIIFSKTLTLIGSGPKTIIDATNTGTTIAIRADHCNVSKFTITGASSTSNYGISIISCDYVSIVDCNISKNNGYAMQVDDSRYDLISRCRFDDEYTGVVIGSGNNVLVNNTFSNLDGHGIYGNNITSNNTVMFNRFEKITGYAVEFVALSGCDNKIILNSFYNNSIVGYSQSMDYYGPPSRNVWNTTVGNYWYDWSGYPDTNSDGICESAYTVDAGFAFPDSYDYCPLKRPYAFPEITGPNNNTAWSGVWYNSSSLITSTVSANVTGTTNASWLTIYPNGTIQGMPVKGSYWVNLKVRDLAGYTDSCSFNIVVNAVNHPPHITSSNIMAVPEDSLYSNTYSAADPDGDTLIWELETNATFLSLVGSTLQGTPDDKDIGGHWVNVSVSDGSMSDHTNFTLVVQAVNDVPFINKTMADLTIYEDTEANISLKDWFKDVDSSLTFRCSGNENISVKIVNGMADIHPAQDWSGTEELTFYANDSQFEVADAITINVLPVNDRPIGSVIYLEEDVYYEGCDQYVVGNATDADLPYGDALDFTWYSNMTGQIGMTMCINLSLSAGHYRVILNVTDKSDAYCLAFVDIQVLKVPVVVIPSVNNTNITDDDDDDDINITPPDDDDDDIKPNITDDDDIVIPIVNTTTNATKGNESDGVNKWLLAGGVLAVTAISVGIIAAVGYNRKRKKDQEEVESETEGHEVLVPEVVGPVLSPPVPAKAVPMEQEKVVEVAFDLSAIPKEAEIESVSLVLQSQQEPELEITYDEPECEELNLWIKNEQQQ